jgi:hypothetical protein
MNWDDDDSIECGRQWVDQDGDDQQTFCHSGPNDADWLPPALPGQPTCGEVDTKTFWECTREPGHPSDHAAHEVPDVQYHRWPQA